MKLKNYKRINLFLFLIMLMYVVLPLFNVVGKVSADALTDAEMRFYRLKVNTAVDSSSAKLLIKFTPGATATENEVRVSFYGSGTQSATDYGVNATNTNITVSTTGLPTGCTAAPGIGSSANAVVGNVTENGTARHAVDFTVTDLTATTTYCFFITGGITSPTSAGTPVNRVATLTGTNSLSEDSEVAVQHVSDDQVVISAVVPATFTFALSSNTDAFTTNLSSSTHRFTSGVTGTVTTNANSGWTAFLKSANGSLNSATTGDTIATTGAIDNAPTAVANGAEHYLLDVDESADAGTNGAIDAEYDGNQGATPPTGGTFNSSDLEAIASGTGATSNYVFTMKGLATISGTTEAANDYTDTWTVVASGNF